MLGGEGKALVEESTCVFEILAQKKCLPNKSHEAIWCVKEYNKGLHWHM